MLPKFRFYIMLICARVMYFGMKLLKHKGGTSFIGMTVLKFEPEFLKYCRDFVSQAVTITGTNGKTTTSGLVAHILDTNSNSVIHNTQGANMLTGVANMFALGIKPCSKFDFAVIESDEAYLTKLYDYFNADYLLVTNLFRDQLDRYGELLTTASFIQNAIDKNKNLKLILNADDPLVSNFGKNREALYYGIEKVNFHSASHKNSSSAPTEIFNCICGSPLEYSERFFAQEGHYFCRECGYKRPEPDICATIDIFDDYSLLNIKWQGEVYSFKSGLVGLYNAYNILGAVAFALVNNISTQVIEKSLLTYKSIFGRAEKRLINGHQTLIQLIKNPTGASEVLKTVNLNSHIIVAINDNYADGRDISWLWDSDFEQIKDAKSICASGERAYDVALRLKYAGVNPQNLTIEPDTIKAIKDFAQNSDSGDLTILPSYTALLKINKTKF